jgi:hypothetical protein
VGRKKFKEQTGKDSLNVVEEDEISGQQKKDIVAN